MKHLLLVIGFFIAFHTGVVEAQSSNSSSRADSLKLMFEIAYSTNQSSSEERARKISHIYDENFRSVIENDEQLRSAPSEELGVLFDASYANVFYTKTSRSVEDLKRVNEEIGRRNLAKSSTEMEMLESLVLDRRFADANEMAMRAGFVNSDIPRLHLEQPGAGPKLLINDGTDRGFRTVGMPLRSGELVVVIGHPSCHFTRDAAIALYANPELREYLKSKSIWIAPQSGKMETSSFFEWNSNFQFPLHQVWRESEWPDFMDHWATPTFYFLKDGQLIKKIVGWPALGKVEEIRTAITELNSL